MNEKKVNTKIGDETLPRAKKEALAREYAGVIETPYGYHYINRGEAIDHAAMRARQLSSLLRLMQTEKSGADRFCMLGPLSQDSLLWLGVQMADELQVMGEIILADGREDQL